MTTAIRVPKRHEVTTPDVAEQVRNAVYLGHIGLVGIFCDRCGFTERMDCTGETVEARFAAARRYLALNDGWQIREDLDLCPFCS